MWCAETQPILPLSTVSDVAFVGFCMLRELRNWPQAAFLVLRKFLSKHQSSLYLVLANISDISAQIYVVPINLVPMHLVPNPELVCATSKKSAAKAARGCLVGKKAFLASILEICPVLRHLLQKVTGTFESVWHMCWQYPHCQQHSSLVSFGFAAPERGEKRH